jgi:hypothetical protein
MTYKTDFEFYKPEMKVVDYKAKIQTFLEAECKRIYENSSATVLKNNRIDYVKKVNSKTGKRMYLTWVERDITDRRMQIMLKQLWNVKKTPMQKLILYCENFKYTGNLIPRLGELKHLEKTRAELMDCKDYIERIDTLLRHHFNAVICKCFDNGVDPAEVPSHFPDLNEILQHDRDSIKKVLVAMWQYWISYANYSLIDSST